MVTSTVLYVVSVAGPALLLAIAIDALRSRPFRILDALAWCAAAAALGVALVYPSLVEVVSQRTGVSIPIALVSCTGIGALFAGYVRQRARITLLEARILEWEGGREPDEPSDHAADGAVPEQGGASPPRGGSASA